jgi:dihydrofolate reductase
MDFRSFFLLYSFVLIRLYMYITIIAAVAQNMAIGNNNQLLYWLPNDLKRFKALTTGHTIIMGRKTFDSLPKGALPNRRNVVLSRTLKELPGAEVFPDLQTALASCTDSEDIYVIGGESVYRQAMPFANRLCLTEIDSIPEQADAFFPPVDESEWTVVSREFHDIDEKHDYKYCFVDYVK